MLTNVKHERFARYIAKGIAISKAYSLAGFKPSYSNASVLYNGNSRSSQKIRQRVAVLVKDSSKLSAQDILDRVYAVAELSQESGQFASALKALEMLGKEKGLWRDRRENVSINLNALSWNETVTYLQHKYGERADRVIALLKGNNSDLNSTVIDNENQPVMLVGANVQHNISDCDIEATD